jgi:catechol 2,3-dioxygenase-like lactoylglutathione lyase family enzyme
MLTDAPVMTMIPVVNIERARKFYDQLGLTYKTTLKNGNVLYACNGATLALYQRATPTRAEHTALSFEVTDIRAEIARLRQVGVVFEEYDLPDFKTVDSVCVLGAEKAAWFKDPEGNILCIHQDG